MNYVTEAIREWAWNIGADPHNIDRQWLLTDYDSWERNPHYTGPDMGHPDDEWMTVGLPTGANDPPYYNPVADVENPAGVPDDDIPF